MELAFGFQRRFDTGYAEARRRIEGGKLVVQAEPKIPLRHYQKDGYKLDHFNFFMDRFGPSFRVELQAFFGSVANGTPPSPGPVDALESLKSPSRRARRWSVFSDGYFDCPFLPSSAHRSAEPEVGGSRPIYPIERALLNWPVRTYGPARIFPDRRTEDLRQR